MDAIKLLGDLLGNQSMARGGTAQSILKLILSGSGLPEGPTATSAPPRELPRPTVQPTPQTMAAGGSRPLTDWDAPARSPAEVMRSGGSYGDGGGDQASLADLIRRAVEGYSTRQTQTTAAPAARTGAVVYGIPEPQSNRQAEVLIRAMINAAKSDGSIDQQEQQNIISKLGQLSQDEVEFLRHEFAQPLNVADFARHVPRGLEIPVYTLSLTAINLDTNREAQYLHQLARCLGLSPEKSNEIHAQLGAPALYS